MKKILSILGAALLSAGAHAGCVNVYTPSMETNCTYKTPGDTVAGFMRAVPHNQLWRTWHWDVFSLEVDLNNPNVVYLSGGGVTHQPFPATSAQGWAIDRPIGIGFGPYRQAEISFVVAGLPIKLSSYVSTISNYPSPYESYYTTCVGTDCRTETGATYY